MVHQYDRRTAVTLSPLGKFRTGNPEAPKLFANVAKTYTAYLEALQSAAWKLEDLAKDYVFAKHALEKAVKEWGGAPVDAVMGNVLALQARTQVNNGMMTHMVKDWKAYKGSDELTIGPSPVHR